MTGPAKKLTMTRLNVLLQKAGVASRRKADKLIEAGLVKVNGEVVSKLGCKVPSNAKISVNEKLLKRAIPKVTYLFNKPCLTITSRKDEKDRPTIFDLPALQKLPANVQAVGRLDYRSEGLLILTNDGELSLALAHPRYSVKKTYAVLLSSMVTPEHLKKLKAGVELEDGVAKAISVKKLTKATMGATAGQWLEIVVTEGRNRLIRRMMEALNLNVVRLVRIAVGKLYLPEKLETGKVSLVKAEEKKYLESLKEELLAEKPSPKEPRKKKI